MELTTSPLYDEVQEIWAKGRPVLAKSHTAEFLIEGQELPLVPLRVVSVDTIRDYVNSFGDEIVLEVIFGAGTFAHQIYPKRKDLNVRLLKTTTLNDGTEETTTQLFRAVLIDDRSGVMEGNNRGLTNQHVGDITDLKYVKFQLVDQALELIRMTSVGGIFHNAKTSEVIRYLLTSVSKDLDVDESNRVTGVNMVEPNNAETQRHVVIPHGTPFPDMPDYIARKCAAPYSAGLGVYLQNHLWYVYPTHDTSRYEKALKTLTVVNIPAGHLPQSEVTYRQTANQVIIMATGTARHIDPSEQQQLTQGNGVRFTDARKILDGFSETSGNRAMVLRADNNHEYAAAARKSALNYVTKATAEITSNVFHELSKMSRRKGAVMQVQWENSDPSLIYPGMPVKVLYLVKGEVFESVGTVQAAHHVDTTTRPGFDNSGHITMSALTLHLDGLVDWESVEEEIVP